MPSSLFRLHVVPDLSSGQVLGLPKEQQHYLLNVLRLKEGGQVLLFNGRDGEWLGQLATVSRKKCMMQVMTQTRPQETPDSLPLPDVHYLFAPLKRSRLDYMVQKATELGVARIQPVVTRYTNVGRVKLTRMQANVVEAAEQCGILRVPEVDEPAPLMKVLDGWDESRTLVFCDESAAQSSPLAQLARLPRHSPLAVLIGPEGGFAPEESEVLRSKGFVMPISLGPRIMRADTAAVAALTLVNACVCDW